MILGIDVGISGAVAVLDGDKLVEVHDMPTVTHVVSKRKRKRVDSKALHEILRMYRYDAAYIEKVSARPNQGVSSMFAFGQATGIAEGVTAGLAEAMYFVRPQEWKKHYALGNDKDASRELAADRWPDMAHMFKRKKDDGRAEAALIGLWGYECHRTK